MALLQRQGDVSWGPGQRSAGDQLGGDTLQLPQWVLLGGTECIERGMEDPARAKEKADHRGWQKQCHRGPGCSEAAGGRGR